MTTTPYPDEATPEAPVYRKSPHMDGWATQLWMVICNEGWRESIVCDHMYEWSADWMLEVLGRLPYAPGRH